MLPNHAPLMVAEAFGTLAELHPGRIDLGLGRAPGTDQATMRALRRYMGGADTFPQDVVELMGWFEPPVPGQTIQAVPGAGADVQMWILGSSLFGAQLAALTLVALSDALPDDSQGERVVGEGLVVRVEELDDDLDPDSATPEERRAKVMSFAEKLSDRKEGKP
jgi:alkanesulfonate monooxygenase SsuD/methylene tetrahydromethanopterin reductase-like flavin-dependent oxidoreductase (luciferase family)